MAGRPGGGRPEALGGRLRASPTATPPRARRQQSRRRERDRPEGRGLAGGEPPSRRPASDAEAGELRKLRIALVLAGLSRLAFVSWIFGIMMAVAQDLPALESRDQYERAQNSIVYDVNGEKLATLTNNQGRILLAPERSRRR